VKRTKRPRILVTNDDGIFSEGLLVLEDALRAFADVVVVAPDREQSAVSHALTIRHPLRATPLAPERWAVDGTPTDCVNLGVLHLSRRKLPDLVVSGINFGSNLGEDVTYSGTVSAAFEASIRGIPSIAISQQLGEGMSFGRAAAFAAELARSLLSAPRRKSPWILNVNVPVGEPAGVEVVRLGRRELSASVVAKKDPRGQSYYWIGQIAPGRLEKGTDFEAIGRNRITVTPLHLDLTAYDELEGTVRLLGRRPRPSRPTPAVHAKHRASTTRKK
jgi:5'-nucleotidase